MPKPAYSLHDLTQVGAQHPMRPGNSSQFNRPSHGTGISPLHLSVPGDNTAEFSNMQNNYRDRQNHMPYTGEGDSALSYTASPYLTPTVGGAGAESVISSDLYFDDLIDENFAWAETPTSANRSRLSNVELPDLFYGYDPVTYAKYRNACSRSYADYHSFIRNSLKKHWARGDFEHENISKAKYERATQTKAYGQGKSLAEKHTAQYKLIRQVLFGTALDVPIQECADKGTHQIEKPKRSAHEKQARRSGGNQSEVRGALSTPTISSHADGRPGCSVRSSHHDVSVNNSSYTFWQGSDHGQAVARSANSSQTPTGHHINIEQRVQVICQNLSRIYQVMSESNTSTAYSNYDGEIQGDIEQIDVLVNNLTMKLTGLRAYMPSQHHPQQQMSHSNSTFHQARGSHVIPSQRRTTASAYATPSNPLPPSRNNHNQTWPDPNTGSYHYAPR